MPGRSDKGGRATGASETPGGWEKLREQILGLGETSVRKSYYPELQRQLAELERFRLLLDHTKDAIFLVAMPGGTITDINAAAANVVGRPREDLLRARLADILPQNAWEEVCVLHGAPTDDARRRHVETRLAVRGSVTPIELTVGAATLDGTDFAVVVVRDVTERVRMQEELRHAQRLESVGRLAGGIAHDFNNLLSAIRGYAEFVQGELEPKSQLAEDVREVIHAADRAAALTRQLLAFGRRQVLQPAVLDLNSVVQDVERLLQRLLGEDVRLAVRLDPWIDPINADRSQLEQVLVNLAVNARDAMPRGGTLTIETEALKADGCVAQKACDGRARSCVVIRVTDTGHGMDEVTRAHLFEPFFTTKAPGRGTGLGLATVYGIVRQSGGDVRVRSAPGEGACFEICLPCAQHGAASLSTTRDGPEALDSGGGRETVLVVEDEDVLRALVVRVLRSRGYTVLEAADAAQAFATYASHPAPPDLLLTDVVLPGESGIALAERLGRDRPELPVLYMSGYSAERLPLGPGGAVGVALLVKPFTAQELARRVRAVLDAAVDDRRRAGRG